MLSTTLGAQQLFEQNVSQSIWQILIQSVRGSKRALRTLPDMNPLPAYEEKTRKSHIALNKIVGSFNPGRTLDFDGDFRPRHRRLAERWISIAGEFLRGGSLPPVILVVVGDEYFVLDGHHRISVAAALGHEAIMAVVIDG